MKKVIVLILMMACTVYGGSRCCTSDPANVQLPFGELDCDTIKIANPHITTMPYRLDNQSGECFIVCEKLDTIYFEPRTITEEVDCPDGREGCLVLHWATRIVWEPVTQKRELCRIPISCDDAKKIDTRYLKVIR